MSTYTRFDAGSLSNGPVATARHLVTGSWRHRGLPLIARLRSFAAAAPENDVLIDFGHARLPWPTAYQIALEIEALVTQGFEVACFADDPTPAFLIAAAPATRRLVPPLSGPIVWTAERHVWDASRLVNRFGSVERHHSADLKAQAQLFSGSPDDEAVGRLGDTMTRLREHAEQHLARFHAPTVLSPLFDGGFASGAHAAESGLVQIGYRSSLRTKNPPMLRGPRDVLAAASLTKRGRELLVAEVSGPILSTAPIRRCLATASASGCKGLLLVIDSPGGDLAAADESWTMLRDYSATTPICAYVLNAESAGYLLASAATHTVINPLGAAGSAASVSWTLGIESALHALGLTRVRVASPSPPPDGNALAVERNLVSEALLRRRIEERHSTALHDTARLLGRRTIRDPLDAESALAAGLVDEIGSLDDAIGALRSLAPGDGRAALVNIRSWSALPNSARWRKGSIRMRFRRTSQEARP